MIETINWEKLLIDTLQFIAIFFILTNLFYIVLIWASSKVLKRKVGYWPYITSENPPISLIVPAYNEEVDILDSLDSFLSQKYSKYEIIIVNDGSKDKTLEKILHAYKFEEIGFNPDDFKLCQTKIKKMYYCPSHNITLIDKENGGKADALNAGIDISKYDFFCAVDADSVIRSDAFNRVMVEFSNDKNLIACGATIRTANGSQFKKGKLLKEGVSNRYLELCQQIEYIRSFLLGRIGWEYFKSTMIISGAFGMFKKKAVLEVGGYNRKSLGEDMDLIVRLHKFKIKNKHKSVIGYIPDPLCWTEVPDNFKTLSSQRNRWQRGLLGSIFNDKKVFFKSNKESFFSVMAIPYYLLTEVVSPFLEILSYILISIGLFFGILDLKIVLLFFSISLMYSLILSLYALNYDEEQFPKLLTRFPTFDLIMGTVIENFGYRQFIAWQRFKGTIDFFRKKGGWGKMDRSGFKK